MVSQGFASKIKTRDNDAMIPVMLSCTFGMLAGIGAHWLCWREIDRIRDEQIDFLRKEQRARLDDLQSALAKLAAPAASARVVQKRPDRMKQTDIQAILSAYIAGESLCSLAKKHNVSYPTVRRRLVERGVFIRTQEQAQRLFAMQNAMRNAGSRD